MFLRRLLFGGVQEGGVGGGSGAAIVSLGTLVFEKSALFKDTIDVSRYPTCDQCQLKPMFSRKELGKHQYYRNHYARRCGAISSLNSPLCVADGVYPHGFSCFLPPRTERINWPDTEPTVRIF